MSREPNSWIRALAVFSPMPGTPGTLSVGSPQRARTSTDLVGGDAEDLADPGLVEGRLLGRVVDGRGRVDDLEEVLVGGDDDGPQVLRLRLAGQGGQDVVGLVSFEFGGGDAHGVEDLLEDRDLDDQVLGHRLAVGLVVLVGLVADGRPLDVEDDAEVVGLLLVDDLSQRGDEAVDGVCRETGRRRQVPDGIIGPVEERVAVDEKKPLRLHDLRPGGPSGLSRTCPRRSPRGSSCAGPPSSAR